MRDRLSFTEMSTHNYTKLMVYHKSLDLAVKVIKVMDDIPQKRLASQMISACVSIPSNIVEGSKRSGRNEFKRFLEYSSGSAEELQTQLIILKRAEVLNDDLLSELILECAIVCKMLNRLQQSLK